MFVDMLEVWKQRRFNLRELLSSFSAYIPRTGVEIIKSWKAILPKSLVVCIFVVRPKPLNSLTAALKRWRWSGEKSKMKSPVNLSLIASTGGNARDVRRAKGIGVSKVRYEPALIAVNPFIGMNLGRYCTQWRSALLTSATLAITNTPEGGMGGCAKRWRSMTIWFQSKEFSLQKAMAL
jgi:ATP-dependent DNA helicase DinG